MVGVGVRRIQRHENGWRVSGDGADGWDADVLVLACPAYQQACLIEEMDAGLAQMVRTIPYNRVAVVALGYREDELPCKLDGFGFLAGPREGLELLGAQWCSSIYPERAPNGLVLLRAMCGGWRRPEIAGWDDERLLGAMRGGLERTMRIRAKPVFHHIVRWERAIPQYLVGHQERVAEIEKLSAQHRGLYLAGNAYHGVALNDCTEQAERLAARIVSDNRGTTNGGTGRRGG